MPVLLQPAQFDHWLSGKMGVEDLKPAANDTLQRWAVSKRVNSSKADKDDATLIERVGHSHSKAEQRPVCFALHQPSIADPRGHRFATSQEESPAGAGL